jgi:hypothetical protein
VIRRATAADLDPVAAIAVALCATFGPDYPKPDRSHILAELRRVIENGFILVSERCGTIDGALALERGRFSFSAEPVIFDRGFYATGSGRQLLAAARALGRALGLPVYVTRFTRATVRLAAERPSTRVERWGRPDPDAIAIKKYITDSPA